MSIRVDENLFCAHNPSEKLSGFSDGSSSGIPPNPSTIPESPPDNRRLDLQLDLLSSECLQERGSGRKKPPIVVVDNELPTVSPFLIEPDKRNRFKLYTNDANRQEYAGYYYDFEVAYFLRHWPRLPAPSVAEFIAVAEQVVSRGYVPPSQMSAEQIQVLKGGCDAE